ncbi:30S ribosome-binding factor RbfA [Rickettsia endosymbiont of Halotydeus destructor]|uniref:30S ribosome-binding factor RbfA n=1 Tax=Rickettsia endosymbiont of Halotydeus destructor TaxID=2996754 RepID=UPI003BB0BEA9
MKKLEKTNSHRQHKVATLINEALIEILRRGRMLDVRLFDCPITITKVLVTADLKIANCYFLPFNTNLKEAELIEALNKSKYAIRNFVTQKINMKFSPDIRFHYDHGFDNAAKVEKLLKQTKMTEIIE